MAYDEIKWGVDQVNKKLTKLGYPPKAMRGYNVQDAPGAMVKIYFTPPANTYLKDQENVPVPLVTVDGVEIRKKKGSPIESRSDGEFFRKFGQSEMNNYITTPLIDEDVEIGEKYYYRFFPYSTYGTYNDYDNSQHGVTVTEEGHMLIFGFDQDFRDLNPDTQITYPEDCENFGYEPMNIKEELGDITAGGWEHFLVNVLHNAPYMVKRNGEVDYELDHENYKYKINGEESDWNNENYQGMAMAWISTMYKKEWYTEDGDVRHVRYCEGVPVGEQEEDWIPVGSMPNDTTRVGVRKGIFIPIGTIGQMYASEEANGILSFNKYNTLSNPKNTNLSTTFNESRLTEFYFGAVQMANNFCSSGTILSTFSTIFYEPHIQILLDYLHMTFKTTDLRNKTISSANATPNIETDYSTVPGFSANVSSASRLFYSYALNSASARLISPYYMDSYRFLMRAYANTYTYSTNTAFVNVHTNFSLSFKRSVIPVQQIMGIKSFVNSNLQIGLYNTYDEVVFVDNRGFNGTGGGGNKWTATYQNSVYNFHRNFKVNVNTMYQDRGGAPSTYNVQLQLDQSKMNNIMKFSRISPIITSNWGDAAEYELRASSKSRRNDGSSFYSMGQAYGSTSNAAQRLNERYYGTDKYKPIRNMAMPFRSNVETVLDNNVGLCYPMDIETIGANAFQPFNIQVQADIEWTNTAYRTARASVDGTEYIVGYSYYSLGAMSHSASAFKFTFNPTITNVNDTNYINNVVSEVSCQWTLSPNNLWHRGGGGLKDYVFWCYGVVVYPEENYVPYAEP